MPSFRRFGLFALGMACLGAEIPPALGESSSPRVSFVGNKSFSDETLRDKIGANTTTLWRRLFRLGEEPQPDHGERDKDLLRKFYLAAGYLDFRIVSVAHQPTADGDSVEVITIEEGERYKFGKIGVTTRLERLNPGTLRAMTRTREGAWFNADQVERATAALTEAGSSKGYVFVAVRPNISRNPGTSTVDVDYEVGEGPRLYVERINITGNTRTHDKVIRRQFRVAEGDAFNLAKIQRAQKQLRDLGYFERVDVSHRPGSASDKVIIDVRVDENRTGEVSLGAGYSTSWGPLGDILWREPNFLGRGQDARAGLAVGTRIQQFDLSFTEPYLFDRNLAVGIDGFGFSRDYQRTSSFDERTFGGALRAGWPLWENTRQTLKYTLRHDQIRNVDEKASAAIKAQAGKTWTSEIGQVLAWDTRDKRQGTTKGWWVRYSLDYAGLGGTEHYVRNKLEAQHFSELFFDDVVLMIAGQGGVINRLNDDVKLANRFSLGGDNFRGFRLGGVGPQSGGDALGGKYYYVTTAELSVPIGSPTDVGLFGKAFVDAGSLWGAEEKGPGIFDSKSVRVSAGIGLEWLSPFGPIRVDYAVPLRRERWDKRESIRVSFGTRY